MPDDFSLDPQTYAYLRSLAAKVMGTADHTIQPTGLVHEAWSKIAGKEQRYADRAHFVRTAAKAMRHILVDRARARHTHKRGGGNVRTTLTGIGHDPREKTDILELDRALKALEEAFPQAAQVVLLRTFGGLTVPETAQALDMTTTNVKRQWRFARVWLLQRMDADPL